MDFKTLVKSGVDKTFRDVFFIKHRDIYDFLSTHENLNKFIDELALEIYNAERAVPNIFAQQGLKKFDDTIASYAKAFAKGALNKKEREIKNIPEQKTAEEYQQELEDELIEEGLIEKDRSEEL